MRAAAVSQLGAPLEVRAVTELSGGPSPVAVGDRVALSSLGHASEETS